MEENQSIIQKLGFKTGVPRSNDIEKMEDVMDFSVYTIGNAYNFQSTKDSIKTSTWLDEYNVNPRLGGLNKIADDNGVTEYGIFKYDTTKGKIQILDHPLEEILDEHTVPMFFSLWTAYRFMTGVTYIALDMTSGQPTGVKLFTLQHLENKVESGEQKLYSFKSGSKTYTYPSENVIVDLALELNDPYNKGFGRAGAIMEQIESATFIQKYLKSFYVNSARPDAFIIPKAGQYQEIPSDDSLQKVSDGLREMHKGIENAHKMAILNFDANIQTIPTNHHEMQLLETSKQYRDESHQHFGIPPEIVGIVENSNKATVVAAEHIYAKQVRMPQLKHFQDIINSLILPRFPLSENLVFEFQDILPDDQEFRRTLAREGREGGSITINEHREFLGLGRLAGEVGNLLIGAVNAQPQTPTGVVGEDGEEQEVAIPLLSTQVEVTHEEITQRYRGKKVLKSVESYTKMLEEKLALDNGLADINDDIVVTK